MKKSFILLFSFWAFIGTNLQAQCNRPIPSDNPCTAPTFCNNDQLDGYCSTVTVPVTGKKFLKPAAFCGSLESPSWFKFIADAASHQFTFTANGGSGCNGNGVQAAIFDATDCMDSSTFVLKSNCINATGGTPVGTVIATNLTPGRTYYILVDGYQGEACSYQILNPGSNIRPTNEPLPTPSVIYGATTVCQNATNVTYSVPRVLNAVDYKFDVTINGTTTSFTRADSFYTVASFPAVGTARVCVSYVNDCTTSAAPKCLDITITNITTINLPTAYLCPGQTYTLPDGNIVDNSSPPATDETTPLVINKTGSGGCDTTFNVTVVKYADKVATQYLFLKPTETKVVCGTSVSIPAATCPSLAKVIVCSGGATTGCDSIINLTIFNAKSTTTILPANPTINCNTVNLSVNHANTCAGLLHISKYEWYFQALPGDPLSNLGNQQGNLTVSQTGIYTVVVRDSVYLIGQPSFGSRVFIDTVSTTVTGTSGMGAPTQPNLINGKTDSTICQGSRTVLTIPAVANATSYIWSLTRNGGTIFSGQGTTSVTIDWSPTTSGDTVVVSALNTCGTSPARRLAILVLNFPNLDAGIDRTVCGTIATLAASNSTPNGSWSSASSNVGGVVFTDATLPNTAAQVTQPGVYQLIWRETVNACSKADTVEYTFNPIPQGSNVKDSCNVTRTNYFVKFNITGGTPPYKVYFANTTTLAGTVGAGGLFSSNSLTLGANAFEIKDTNLCSPSPPISVTQGCTTCSTRAGTMDVATDLSICEGDTARATYLGGYVNDGNDTLQFVLHRGDPRSGIIARSNVPRFGYTAGMLYETRYYISAIAGDDSTKQVKLTDACFSYSPGVAIIFHKKPTATIAVSDSNLCAGSCTNLRFNMTGKSPFSMGVRLTDTTTRDTSLNLIINGYLAQICPTRNTTYRLYSVRDSFGCSDTTLNVQKRVNIFPKAFAGTPNGPLSICSSLDTTITLSTLLTNATAGGTWSEVSTAPSTGGAFTAATGRFRTRSQTQGIYRFAYTVRPTLGSPCPNDTAFVNIEIKFTPIADAGIDDTIKCNKPQVRIGGPNTSTGNTVFVAWSGGIGGNTPQQDITQPGTFILMASFNGCSARDTVVIYVDTITPRAAITPVTQTLSCAIESVELNGSKSSPAGEIGYLWFFNGIPFDNNPITEGHFGGSYALSVINLNNGCVNTDSIRIDENRILPTVNIARPLTINCKDTVVTIDASTSSRGSQYTLKWQSSNGGRFLADSTTLTPKVNVSGFYLLVITDTTNSCKDSTFAFVPIDTLHPIALGLATDSLDCTNPTIALNGRGSTLGASITYNWQAQTGHIQSGATSLNPVIDEPGLYVLTVQNSKNYCTGIDTVEVVKNNERPTSISISTKKPTCYGECDASLRINSVTGGTGPYLYSLDAKVFTTRNSFQNQCAGTFNLTVQDAGGCVLDTTFSIVQDKQLSVSLGADTTIKLGDTLVLKVLTNADTIKNIVWNIGDSTKCGKNTFCTEQLVRPTRGTTYTATLTDQNGCRTVGRIAVSIDKRRPVFIPTAFSPNNDSYNDVLMIMGSQVVRNIKRFQVYDRWGELVFAKANFMPDDPNFGWDGRHKGREALPGVYVYYVDVEYMDNTTEILEGDVTLIR